MAVYFYRRIVFTGCIVVLSTFPSVQIVALLFSTICMLVYCVVFKPYQSKNSQVLSNFNEVTLIILMAQVAFMVYTQIWFKFNSIYGWCMIGNVMFTIGVNWVVVSVYFVQKTIEMCKAKK